MGAENLYHCDYIGNVAEAHYNLVLGFLNHQGLDRVESRLPYIMGATVRDRGARIQLLRNLDAQTNSWYGPTQFVESFRSHKELRYLKPEYRDQWQKFQGATNEILGEGYLADRSATAGTTLISHQQLIETITKLATPPFLYVEPFTPNFVCVGRKYSCPDVVEASVTPQGTTITNIYESKSTADDITLQLEGFKRECSGIRRLFSDPVSAQVIRRALGSLLEVTDKDIHLPSTQDLKITSVVTQDCQPIEDDLKGYLDQIDYIGLPNIRGFAYFVLRCITGAIAKPLNWENQFLPISTPMATTLQQIHRTNTVAIRDRRHW